MNLDHNIVIEASAGTGKTYTLVQTILQALFQKNLPMESLVALTFTKKAAGEMKERIAAELQKIDSAEKVEPSWQTWGHTLDELKSSARNALERIDLAAIGTIHSFAYSLLKRFPLIAGISPDAEVDDKEIRGDDLFEQEWPLWLRRELSEKNAGSGWLVVLEKIPLSEIRKLARRLCNFDVPLETLPLSDEDLPMNLSKFYLDLKKLLAGKPDSVKSTRIAQACEEVLGAAQAGAWQKLESFGADILNTLEETPDKTKDWTPPEISQLKIIKAIALNLLMRGDQTLATLTTLLKPFVSRLRGRLLAEGLLSNNALLVLARDLVAHNLRVRETLKEQIRLIFIDEFQDTDPLQGELLLFLAEERGGRANRWDKVKLEAGKLFIVGDPKQSIYLFRGADISAYGRITRMVLAQGGERLLLEESYRSHEQIIHAVNAAFAPLIQEKPPISPAYQALVPRRKSEDPERHLVELRLAYSHDPQSSDDALEKEAEDAASWISAAKASNLWTYKDIALVFRSTPAMTPFIEKLRAAEIPFVVEGERYFYRTPEVTDVINLLRLLDDPSHRIALAGFLRSPLGGFTDAELVTLQAKNGLNLKKPLPKELDGAAHHGAWELLQRLRKSALREPLKQVLHHVYEDTYLLELAARSYHRDQTIANLFKLRRLMESFSEEGETSLGGLLTKIDRFMEDDRLEGESPLADDTYDAVRLLTIHKAKGLEFPVVWLPGLHRNAGGRADTTKVTARYDWGSEQLGLSVSKYARNMDDFILEKEFNEREEAEEARVLYVAMTRARDHLILSGGVCSAGRSKQPATGSFLAQLAGAWKLDLEKIPEGELRLGEGVITVRKKPSIALVTDGSSKTHVWLDSLNPERIAKAWEKREQAYKSGMETKVVQTPSTLSSVVRYTWYERQEPDSERITYHLPRTTPLLLGTLVHKFLEVWDFSCEKCDMPAKLRQVANTYFSEQGFLVEPFPNPREGDKTNNPRELVEMVEEAQRLLADFIGSEAEEEIKKSQIVGREVPFFFKTPEGPIMRGAMDILYRTLSNQLVIGDYKTDKEQDPTHYTAQAEAYRQAVQLALGEQAAFKLIYLRDEVSTATK